MVRRLLAVATLASLPCGAVLLGLAVLGRLELPAALAAWVGAVTLAIAASRPLVGNLARLSRWLEGGEPDPPALAPAPLRAELGDLARRIGRAAATREDEIDGIRAEFQRLVDALPDVLFILGRDTRIMRANRAARDAFGDGAVGRELALVLRHPALLDAVAAALRGGLAEDVDIQAVGVSERSYAAHVEALPVASARGPALLLVLADRTAAHRVERMRVDFVANASHEIRSPLAAIVGFIETLRGPARGDPEAHERFLGIMADQAARMTQLVQDLLSLSRIEMNEHTQPAGRVDLVKLAGRVRGALAWEAEAKSMTITVAAATEVPDVRGDESELEQVCHNLIGNSVKYADPGTAIEVVIGRVARPPLEVRWTEGEAIALTVRDHGPGIGREHVARLTERFYRVDPARSRQLGGTGLGLAIVKHIVNRHRGALAIESTLGEGSVFTVYLPVT